MPWNTKSENPDQPNLGARDTSAALDAVGALLRTLGKYAFDLDSAGAAATGERFEKWARHILVSAPHPTRPSGAAAEPERDWSGLREFVTGHRRDEYRYVTESLKDLRQVIDAFINTLRSAFAEDQEADAQVSVMLSGLKDAVQGNSIEALKREVLSAIAGIARVIEERRKRHGTQMERLGAELKAMRTQLTEAHHEMELDPLTRLYNRSSFQQTLARTVELARFSGQPACLLMVDADHFKRVNDVHGHPAGDQVLKRLADCCMRTFLRQSDFVSRYGGEEFAIILPNTSISVGRRLADRLLDAVRSLAVECQGQTIRVTVSIGVAELAPGESDERWLARADAALYRAKSLERDRAVESTAGEV